MARADQNNLGRSTRETERQQRQQQPEVPGATGTPDDSSPEAAEVRARKRVGKTEKHTSDDKPAE